MNELAKLEKIKTIITRFGQVDGSHHKMWVLDQILRIILEDGYDAYIKEINRGEDGPETYDWDVGIAP